MQILHNISLKKYNTFGIDVSADHFLSISSVEKIVDFFDYKNSELLISKLPVYILGGGSNILFTKNFKGVILKNELKGIEKIKEDDNYVYVKIYAGENWHQFVMHCIDNNWCGVENLALIPGNVGASPMQNIGAYGVEIKDVFYELEAFNIEDKKIIVFNTQDCEFGYRESIFKRKYRNQFIITSVTFRLNKKPIFNTSYGAIEQELEKMRVQQLSIHAIANAVINIRKSKLPDPSVIGNAGSFFKNPTVTSIFFAELNHKFPDIVGYSLPDENVKLAAGWLIEQCGWRGFRKHDAGCHEKQALVLVNYGHATGGEIFSLSQEIIESVYEKFNVNLEREVNIV